MQSAKKLLLAPFSTEENEDFLMAVAELVKKAQCKLTVCPAEEYMQDRWMQVLPWFMAGD